MLALSDRWLWDFWTAKEQDVHHVFFLCAPKSLGDERHRHWHARIGHAITKDFADFSVLPDISFEYSGDTEGSEPFDSGTRWTGSIIRHQQRWYLFYTGTRRSEGYKYQRIGLAFSDDLNHWQIPYTDALVEPDGLIYERYQPGLWFDQACRDPHVWQDKRGLFHMAFTARVNHGPSDQRGCIGHATSENLLQWQLLEPLAHPGRYGQMEVPQWIEADTHHYLLFCNDAQTVSREEVSRLTSLGRRAETFNHFLVAQRESGVFHEPLDGYLTGSKSGLYAGKLVERHPDDWIFLAFRNTDATGQFCGELVDPVPAELTDGRIVLHG